MKTSLLYLLLLISSVANAQQILLVGSDSRDSKKTGNADLIMVISIKNKQVKLTSIMRDTYVYIEGHGNQKLNAAYRFGGRKLLVSTINKNFKTKLVSSIATNFENTAEAIDCMGGLNIEIEQEIVKYVNQYIKEQSYLKGVAPLLLNKDGRVTLTGDQALAYARVRVANTKYDDYDRVARQKQIIKELLKATLSHKGKSLTCAGALWPLIDTDINVNDYRKTFLAYFSKPEFPKPQVFPDAAYASDVLLDDVGQVLKIKNFKAASAKLNAMIN